MLAPELRVLPDRHRLIWADADARHAALEAIVSAWEGGSVDLAEHIARVDGAVVAALGALALPRGPIAGVEIEHAQRFWTGRKHPDCRLLLDGPAMRQVVRVEGSDDDLMRTWVHESIHARQPYDITAGAEAKAHSGYEEGMVEGLARFVVRDAAGLRPLERSYAYYVAAYETLASLIRVDTTALWRRLWRFPTGRVRAAFVGAVGAALGASGQPHLSASQSGRISAVADQFFASTRRDYPVAQDAMLALWRTALR